MAVAEPQPIAPKPRRRSLRMMPSAFVAFVIFFGWLAIQPGVSSMLKEWKRDMHSKTLLSEIDAISKRLGRVPKDEAELIELCGKPMPEIGWDEDCHYYATDANHFELHLGEWVYDSRTPERGFRSGFQW